MKRFIMAVVAAMVMGSAVMAQSNNGNGAKKAMDKTEMTKKRTEGIAKRYGLDEQQTKKLLELNTKYADSLRVGMGARGNRGMAQVGRQGGGRPQGVVKDSTARKRMPGRTLGEKNGARRMEMSGAMKNYNNQLKAIMTSEQYRKYTEDMQKRPERGGDRMRK